MTPQQKEYQRLYYTQNPKGVYIRQKANSRRRGIGWDLSLADWLAAWEKSGKWNKRGNKEGNYCMARIKREESYHKDNIRIVTIQWNSQDNMEKMWSRK